jgi:hypothetical protein
MNHSTLFIDESGKSSLAVKMDEPFILTGVILDDSKIATIEGFFRYIKRKLGVPIDKPFHSYDLFESEISKITTSKAKKTCSQSCRVFITNTDQGYDSVN